MNTYDLRQMALAANNPDQPVEVQCRAAYELSFYLVRHAETLCDLIEAAMPCADWLHITNEDSDRLADVLTRLAME